MFEKFKEFYSRIELKSLAKSDFKTLSLDKFKKNNEQLKELSDEQVTSEYQELQSFVGASADIRDEDRDLAELNGMAGNQNQSLASTANRQLASTYVTEGFKLLNNYQQELKRRNLSLPTMGELGL